MDHSTAVLSQSAIILQLITGPGLSHPAPACQYVPTTCSEGRCRRGQQGGGGWWWRGWSNRWGRPKTSRSGSWWSAVAPWSSAHRWRNSEPLQWQWVRIQCQTEQECRLWKRYMAILVILIVCCEFDITCRMLSHMIWYNGDTAYVCRVINELQFNLTAIWFKSNVGLLTLWQTVPICT